jgi:proline iminopeptidase
MVPSRALVLIAALSALVLACAGPAAPPEEPEEEPPAGGLQNGSFTANLNGFDIHYEVHGSGPVLMTVPNSWGLSLEGLRALYRPLEERLTMVYFDPRGMGESGAVREPADMSMAAVRADFQALREHLGLEKVHAIGWSNGAMNLILLAAEDLETLSSAIFLHGTASFGPEDMKRYAEEHPEMMARYAAFQQEMADPALSAEEKTARQRVLWVEEFFPLSTADPEGAKALLAETFGGAEFSFAHADYTQREVPVFDNRDKLPGITVPSLVLAGEHDMMPVEKAWEMDAALPDSTLLLFEKSGHFAPVEEPGAFRNAVWQFLGVME